ncbi:MAG: type II toxin-antitoxin system RelE/ParE family toxin [Pyrinomonadaceae bacterium]
MSSSSKRIIQRTKRFGRDIKKLPREVQKDSYETVLKLAEDIFDPTINLRTLTGFHGIFRAVVIRDYRIIFSFDEENLYLLRIGHRREIYRNMEL